MPVAGERVDDTHRLVIEILLALPLQSSWSHCNSLGKMTTLVTIAVMTGLHLSKIPLETLSLIRYARGEL